MYSICAYSMQISMYSYILMQLHIICITWIWHEIPYAIREHSMWIHTHFIHIPYAFHAYFMLANTYPIRIPGALHTHSTPFQVHSIRIFVLNAYVFHLCSMHIERKSINIVMQMDTYSRHILVNFRHTHTHARTLWIHDLLVYISSWFQACSMRPCNSIHVLCIFHVIARTCHT